MAKERQTMSTEQQGRELPDAPGVWLRFNKKGQLLGVFDVDRPNPAFYPDALVATEMVSCGYIKDSISVKKLPKGNWHPATSEQEELDAANRRANAAETLNSNQRVMLTAAEARVATLEAELDRLRVACL